MRRVSAFLLLLLLAASAAAMESVEAPEAFADLSALAPEGSFLEPGSEPLVTEDSYRSENVCVQISRLRSGNANVTVADIRVRSVRHLRRAFGSERWKGSSEKLYTIALRSQAVVAMNGDFSNLFNAGLVVANGTVLRKSGNRKRDHCLILKDGRMLTYQRGTMDLNEALEEDLWQSFLFGPSLLSEGVPYEKIHTDVAPANPRSVLGYYEPGHYCFVQVEGRSSKSRGMNIRELAAFMAELGCQAAYNLDGGQSSSLYFHGALITTPPKNGRRVADIVYIAP